MSVEYWTKLWSTAYKEYGILPEGVVGVLTQVSKDDGCMWERIYEFDEALYNEIELEIKLLNACWKENTPPKKPDVIVIEDGVAKINFEVAFSNFPHYIIGDNYAEVLAKAKTLVTSHSYYRKKNPMKIGEVERKIQAFNNHYEKFIPNRLRELQEKGSGSGSPQDANLHQPPLEGERPVLL